jgi:glyoxylase-like metal-dependent hydrolase (beta-lactamase superfamily II)
MKKFKKGLASLVAVTAMVTMFSTVGFAKDKVNLKTLDGIVVSDPTTETVNGKTVITVDMLTQGKKMQLKTQGINSDKVNAVKANLAKGNLVDYKLTDGVVEVPSEPSKTFNKVLSKGDGKAVQFDSMKYGQELSPSNGEAGNMVAAGWVYGKTDKTITIGDGKVVTADMSGRALSTPSKPYEETYKLDNDVKVYNVNTADYSVSSVSDFASIPVTKDHNYTTTERQAAYVVFDRNYKQTEAAKVTAIYYFTPQSTSDGKPVWDVPELSFLLKGKGTDSVSGKSYDQVTQNKPASSPYTRSTEPFEIVKDTFYYVGDNEVAVYLFNADMGTNDKKDDRLIVFDAGWPNSGYQYWKNIEAVGFDPRKVTDIMLTHGHGDHYGTAVELINMIENAGGSVKLYGSKEDTTGIKQDALGNTWDIKGALPASETEIIKRTIPYEYDKYMEFGNVQILVTPTPGHTPGTASFIFKTKNPDTDKWVTFGYNGGYGFNGLEKPKPTNGYLRLNFQAGLAWLQQMVDVDYVAPQHTNQYPMVEVYQALKAYNNDPANAKKQLTMLDALTKNEFINFAEKRYSVATNKASDAAYDGNTYQSIETYGPFKPGRENGLAGIKATLLDGGKIIQGFNKVQNKNPEIPLLKDGVIIDKDSYVNDPDGWYVQFYIDVLDSYGGFLPGSGPIESLHATPGAPEVLRTQRLNSKEEAEAILNSIKKGGTYSIDLTKASAIVVPENVTDTFKEVK